MVSTQLTYLVLMAFLGVLGGQVVIAISEYIKGRNRGKNLAVIVLSILIALMMLNIFNQYLGIMGGM